MGCAHAPSGGAGTAQHTRPRAARDGQTPSNVEPCAEFQTIVLAPATVSFKTGLRIDLGGGIVELTHLGRDNTGGDVVAWLPAERILVAGDLVDHPVPYAFGDYPTEWIATLGRLAGLDPLLVVPGHGEVLVGKAHIERVAALLRHVHDQVAEQFARHGGGVTLDAVQKAAQAPRLLTLACRKAGIREYPLPAMSGYSDRPV